MVPVPGPTVEQGTREVMTGQGTWEAMADPGTREAMTEQGAWAAMADPSRPQPPPPPKKYFGK